MQRIVVAFLMSAFGMTVALAQPMQISPRVHLPRTQPAMAAAQPQSSDSEIDLGGGFIEFLFGGGNGRSARFAPASPPVIFQEPVAGQPDLREPSSPPPVVYARGNPAAMTEPARPAPDPRFLKQEVTYDGPEKPGTIIIDTPRRHLFLVQPGGKAIRYGIGVGRPGFTWAGVKQISAKREWPDWRPPEDMLQRRPDLPRYMAGGPENPLGARAMYLGSTLYRIHGSNEPWTIGHAVSSGCIRMRNEDVIDLYERVKLGTKVIVI